MDSPEFLFIDQIWEGLKIPVILIAVIGPIVIVILILRFKRTIKALEAKYQEDQRIIEKRIEIYERMGPKLHDLYCFYCYNGNWKEITPMDVVRLKKELDKDMQTSAPLFSENVSEKYSGFVQLCFVAHSGWEDEEKIKSLYELRQEHNVNWDDDWIQYFDTNNVLDAIRMKERYDALLECFKQDLGPVKES